MKSIVAVSFAILLVAGQLNPNVMAQTDSKTAQEKASTDKAGNKKNKKQTTKINPSGTWRWEYEFQGTPIKDALRINIGKDGKVTGQLTRNDKSAKIEEGKLDGDKLSFTVNFTGYSNQYVGKIKGDKVEDGTVKLEYDGDSWDFPWTADRKVKMDDIVGTWKLKIERPDGEKPFEPTLKVAKDGKKYKSTYTSGRGTELSVKEIKVEKNNLLLSVTADLNGTSLKVDFKGRPYGDKISGTLDYDWDGNTGDSTFTGIRQASKPSSPSKEKTADNVEESKPTKLAKAFRAS